MCQVTVLICTLHVLIFFLILPSPQSYEVHDIIIILPMKKLRHRAVKYVAEGYTANEQQSQDLRPVSPIHS